MNIIDSLKRLERLGDENSRFTQKAKEAAKIVALRICTNLDTVLLERAERYSNEEGYYLRKVHEKLYYCKTNSNSYGFVAYDNDNRLQEYNMIDYSLERSNASDINREVALDFAKAIAEGLIDHVSTFIEIEVEKAKKSVGTLEAAK
jgi:hypothetical protein